MTGDVSLSVLCPGSGQPWSVDPSRLEWTRRCPVCATSKSVLVSPAEHPVPPHVVNKDGGVWLQVVSPRTLCPVGFGVTASYQVRCARDAGHVGDHQAAVGRGTLTWGDNGATERVL